MMPIVDIDRQVKRLLLDWPTLEQVDKGMTLVAQQMARDYGYGT